MKKKNYKIGKFTCRTYMKTAGHGYEIGAYFGPNKIFTGNFVHRAEANHYWTTLNKDLKTFCKKYWVSPKAPFTWYRNFMKNYFYKNYYTYVNKVTAKHTRLHATAVRKGETRYKRLKKTWEPTEKLTLKNAA